MKLKITKVVYLLIINIKNISQKKFDILIITFINFLMFFFPLKSSGSFFTTSNSTFMIITLVILIGLIKPLIGVIEKEELLPIIRVLTMIISTFLSLVFFIKSFINARKNKKP